MCSYSYREPICSFDYYKYCSHRTYFFPLGFEKPSAIQQRAIIPIVKGRDVIAQAQSGTGKTATFAIAVLQALDTQTRDTQVLTLSPTRELAVQIQKVNIEC